MLESLRQGVQSWYFKALLMLLVASFAIFGIGDIFRGGPSIGAVVTVGDTEISGRELSTAFQRRVNDVSRQVGTSLSVEQARQFGIVDQVVQSLVTEALYGVEAVELGVIIGDDAVASRVRVEPSFQSTRGQFDRAVFEQILAANGMNEQVFVNQLRREIVRDQILGSLAGDLPVSVQLADRLFRWRNERRVAEYIVLKNDPNAKVAAPGDTILRQFHTENAARFTAPDFRRISYIYLTPDDVKRDITISDSEIRDAYESRLDDYKVAESRTLMQMIFAKEEDAQKAASSLAEGREFLAVAKTLAKQDAKTTNLGIVFPAEMPGKLGEDVFKLGKGETSPPLKGPFGWYLIRVNEINAAGTRPLNEVREQIRQQLIAGKAIDVLFDLSNTLQDVLGGGATLADAANQVGAKLVVIAALDRQGRDADGKPIADIPQGLTQNTFITPVGEQSALVDSGEDGYLIVKVESETPSALRPFESVRNDVIDAWQIENRRIRLLDQAEDIAERLNKGAVLRDVATELNLGVPLTSPAFTRDGEDTGNNLTRGLAADLFTAKIGGAASGETATGVTIAVLKEIRKADPITDKTARETIGEQLAGEMTNDLIVQYSNALRDRYTVEVNERALENLFLQSDGGQSGGGGHPHPPGTPDVH